MQQRVIFITGVAGSGKTSVGRALADRTGFPFFDGDDFHSAENKGKMGAGIPLTDEDRIPWLSSINSFAIDHLRQGSLIIACSALKEKYRERLAKDIPASSVRWFHLQGSFACIHDRMLSRNGHYMKADMLRSQFEVYEEPLRGIKINIDNSIDSITDQIMATLALSSVGLIGMGVMGTSLARNIAGKGYGISVYNRYVKGKEEGVAKLMTERFSELAEAKPFEDLKAFVDSLARPRRIILMVNAGKAVDMVIGELMPLLQADDVVMDGGNSHYADTVRRQEGLAAAGVHFVGAGVSGGEEGALLGPSIMPGGSREGYEKIRDVLDAIAAKNDAGETCCGYIGEGGAGHFVKMVHNGIEYAEMALIAEVYTHLRHDQHFSPPEIAAIFEEWNKGEAASYLLEISSDILKVKDKDGSFLIDNILDQAGSKGTGGWTSIAAAELGVPVPAIAEALMARFISAMGKSRARYYSLYSIPDMGAMVPTDELLSLYQFCRLMNHHQGLSLIATASTEFGWNIDTAALLRIWSGGCIIRSELLKLLRIGWTDAQGDIMQHGYAVNYIGNTYPKVADAVAALTGSAHSYPVISSCFQYFKAICEPRSNAYMIQAQRDYFGAHTYQRVDDPGGAAHHTDWLKER